jgi:hypothetical protein
MTYRVLRHAVTRLLHDRYESAPHRSNFGRSSFLPKPFGIAELIQKVRDVLDAPGPSV